MIKLELIKKIDYFSSLPEATKVNLANAMMERHYHRGDKIITFGEPGDGFYIIGSGEVEVQKEGKHVATLEEGKFFGELSLITSEPRTSDVVAVSDDVTAYYIDREAFDQLKSQMPKEIQEEVMRRIMENFKNGL